MTTTNSDVASTDEDGPSHTIPEFCRLEDISLTLYYKKRREGYGPEELRIPRSNIVRITAKARREWHERMAELAQQEAAKLEQQRRVEQARTAGKAAARSPLHVSRRNRADRNT